MKFPLPIASVTTWPDRWICLDSVSTKYVTQITLSRILSKYSPHSTSRYVMCSFFGMKYKTAYQIMMWCSHVISRQGQGSRKGLPALLDPVRKLLGPPSRDQLRQPLSTSACGGPQITITVSVACRKRTLKGAIRRGHNIQLVCCMFGIDEGL